MSACLLFGSAGPPKIPAVWPPHRRGLRLVPLRPGGGGRLAFSRAHDGRRQDEGGEQPHGERVVDKFHDCLLKSRSVYAPYGTTIVSPGFSSMFCFRFLRLTTVLVVERKATGWPPSFRMTMMFLLSANSWIPPAVASNCTTVIGARQRVGARLGDHAGDEHLPAVDRLDDDRDVRVLEELRRRLHQRSRAAASGVSPAACTSFSSGSEIIPSGRTVTSADMSLSRQIQHDQHIVGTDDIAGGQRRLPSALAAGAAASCRWGRDIRRGGDRRRGHRLGHGLRTAPEDSKRLAPGPVQAPRCTSQHDHREQNRRLRVSSRRSLPVFLERQLTIVLAQEIQKPLVVALTPC